MTIRELYQQAEREGSLDRPLVLVLRAGEAKFGLDEAVAEGETEQLVSLPTFAEPADRLEPSGIWPGQAVLIADFGDVFEVDL